MMRLAEFSSCRKYRYTLWRDAKQPELFGGGVFGNPGAYLMVVGLNPSTADEVKNDPTIRWCIRFAKDWGFGRLCMTNLFAFRATDPAVMKRHVEPVGEENDGWLLEIAQSAGMILAAWGALGKFNLRSEKVLPLLRGRAIHCLGICGNGEPKHPLYVPAERTPTVYKGVE